MTERSSDISRRRFIMAGSAAIASPLLLNAAGSMAATKTAENKATVTNAKKGNKIYFIGPECIGCHVCRLFCPAEAIRFGDTGNEIDQMKCRHCGACYRECPISVISETEF